MFFQPYDVNYYNYWHLYSTYNTINYKITLNYFYNFFFCYFLGKWTEQRQRLWPNLQSGKTQTIQRHWFFIAQSMLIPNLLLLGSIMGIRSKTTKSFRYNILYSRYLIHVFFYAFCERNSYISREEFTQIRAQGRKSSAMLSHFLSLTHIGA